MHHLGGSYNSAGDLRFNRLADSGNGTLPGNHNGGDGYHHQLQQSSNYPQVKSHCHRSFSYTSLTFYIYLNYIEQTSVPTKDLPPENHTEFSPHQFPEYTYWAREDRQYYRLVGLNTHDDNKNGVFLDTSTIFDLDDCADGDIDDTIDGDNLDDNDNDENSRIIVRDTSSSYRPALPQERALPLCSEVPCLTRFAFVHIWKKKKTIFDSKTQADNQRTTNPIANQPKNQASNNQPINHLSHHPTVSQLRHLRHGQEVFGHLCLRMIERAVSSSKCSNTD